MRQRLKMADIDVVYSPGTMPWMVTISSRIGDGIFLPLTIMKSFAPATQQNRPPQFSNAAVRSASQFVARLGRAAPEARAAPVALVLVGRTDRPRARWL